MLEIMRDEYNETLAMELIGNTCAKYLKSIDDECEGAEFKLSKISCQNSPVDVVTRGVAYPGAETFMLLQVDLSTPAEDVMTVRIYQIKPYEPKTVMVIHQEAFMGAIVYLDKDVTLGNIEKMLAEGLWRLSHCYYAPAESGKTRLNWLDTLRLMNPYSTGGKIQWKRPTQNFREHRMKCGLVEILGLIPGGYQQKSMPILGKYRCQHESGIQLTLRDRYEAGSPEGFTEIEYRSDSLPIGFRLYQYQTYYENDKQNEAELELETGMCLVDAIMNIRMGTAKGQKKAASILVADIKPERIEEGGEQPEIKIAFDGQSGIKIDITQHPKDKTEAAGAGQSDFIEAPVREPKSGYLRDTRLTWAEPIVAKKCAKWLNCLHLDSGEQPPLEQGKVLEAAKIIDCDEVYHIFSVKTHQVSLVKQITLGSVTVRIWRGRMRDASTIVSVTEARMGWAVAHSAMYPTPNVIHGLLGACLEKITRAQGITNTKGYGDTSLNWLFYERNCDAYPETFKSNKLLGSYTAAIVNPAWGQHICNSLIQALRIISGVREDTVTYGKELMPADFVRFTAEHENGMYLTAEIDYEANRKTVFTRVGTPDSLILETNEVICEADDKVGSELSRFYIEMCFAEIIADLKVGPRCQRE